ncbi:MULTISPECIES: lysozyme inhibitor LprI family protein [unclassified Halomonas]|uniref:lysozyme inhibitor LprI family protein n=1 Tax=unclassified Halomonas TaxID=2609666 RepID=UPI00130E9DD4|nr:MULTISPECIES: lysozyme inhibitor LprI family protein [unclassified Halomonas]
MAATAQSSTEDEYAARFGKCMDASGGVTVEILNCIADEIATQDALLNGAYSDARRDLSEERQQVLLNAQRHWINYRDVNCDFYANIGGTLAQIASNECFLRETAERAAELENMVGW